MVDRVALAPYTLATESSVSATKSTELATMSTTTSCQIQVVANLSPKPATESTVTATNRVTTCLENLEMSGNLTAVREMSVILLKIREMSGKKSCQGKVA